MKNKFLFTRILCLLLIAVATITLVACGGDKDTSADTGEVVEATFTFICTHLDGTQETFTITTTEEFLREALEEEELISGDDGEFGLYVKTVCGEYLDYNVNGKYWALYVGGQYGMNGVDDTPVVDGETYEFKAE